MSKNKSNTEEFTLTELTLKINILAASSLTRKKLNYPNTCIDKGHFTSSPTFVVSQACLSCESCSEGTE